MAEIKAQVRIDAPPEAVFDFIDNCRKAMRYLKRTWRVGLFWVLAVITVCLFTRLGNDSVLALQLAGDKAHAATTLKGMEPGEFGSAVWAVRGDFWLIFLYVGTLWAGLDWASTVYLSSMTRRWAGRLAFALPVAGVLDLLENAWLFKMLQRGIVLPSWLPVAVTSVAYIKFLLISLGVLVLAGAAATRLVFYFHGTKGAPDLVDLRRQSDGSLLEAGEVPSWRSKQWEPPTAATRIGVCCSGGGIRSAAYNLGALQALQRENVLQRATYLAAVSGGAYICGAWAILAKESDAMTLVPGKPLPYSRESPEEDYLRNNTSYIAPNGIALLWGVSRLLLGVLANVIFLGLLIFVVTRPLGWLLGSEYFHDLRGQFHVRPAMWASIGISGGFGLVVALAAIVSRWKVVALENRMFDVARAGLVIAFTLFFVLVALPWSMRTVPAFLANPSRYVQVFDNDQKSDVKGADSKDAAPTKKDQSEASGLAWVLQSLGIGATLLAAIKALVSKHKSAIAMTIGRTIPLILLFVAVTMLTSGGAREAGHLAKPFGPLFWWMLASLFFLFLYAWADQASWSMHPFYKRRLASAFALRRVALPADRLWVEEVDYDKILKLSEYPKPGDGKGPQLLVCAAANVTDGGMTPVKRRAVSYVFSSTEVGGPLAGWLKTEILETAIKGSTREEDVSLMSAIAVSGAAVSPGMGKIPESRLGSVFALVNLRLGLWLPSAQWVQRVTKAALKWRDRPGAAYLLKELDRRYLLEDPFHYVSDGGHWENLGLVELLRRGCTEIYCFDASGDKVESFATLGQAIAMARTELDVDIKIALTQEDEQHRTDKVRLESLPRRQRRKAEKEQRDVRVAQHDHWYGTFTYPGSGVEGRLTVVKLAVTKDAPADVQAYAARDKVFPNHSTFDQLFDHEKFEAYRALGFASCCNALKSMSVAHAMSALSSASPAVPLRDQERPMAEIKAQVRIDAPPEAVFDFIDNWRNAMRYLKRTVRYDLVDPAGGTGVGTEFVISVQAGPSRLDGKIVVTKHERPNKISFRTVEGVRVEGDWTIQPDGEGTHVTLYSSYDPPGGLVGRIVASFIKANAQNDLNASLRELKRLVETKGV